MPISARREGESILVDGIDLKRAARTLRTLSQAPGWRPPADLNQAMELMAQLFGYPNLHAVMSQAAGVSPRHRGATPVDADLAADEWSRWAADELLVHLREVANRRGIVGIVGDLRTGASTWARFVASRIHQGRGGHFEDLFAIPDGEKRLQGLLSSSRGVVFLEGLQAVVGEGGETAGQVATHRAATFVPVVHTGYEMVRMFGLPRDARGNPINLEIRVVDFNTRTSYIIDQATHQKVDVRVFGLEQAKPSSRGGYIEEALAAVDSTHTLAVAGPALGTGAGERDEVLSGATLSDFVRLSFYNRSIGHLLVLIDASKKEFDALGAGLHPASGKYVDSHSLDTVTKRDRILFLSDTSADLLLEQEAMPGGPVERLLHLANEGVMVCLQTKQHVRWVEKLRQQHRLKSLTVGVATVAETGEAQLTYTHLGPSKSASTAAAEPPEGAPDRASTPTPPRRRTRP